MIFAVRRKLANQVARVTATEEALRVLIMLLEELRDGLLAETKAIGLGLGSEDLPKFRFGRIENGDLVGNSSKERFIHEVFGLDIGRKNGE